MQGIENLELDQIICKRNQFGKQRYQVVAESLFFEKYNIIQIASKYIEEQLERKRKSQVEKNDHLMIFAESKLKFQIAINQTYNIDTNKIDIYKQKNKFEFVSTHLKSIMIEHLQIQNQQSQTDKKNTLIIELENNDIEKYKTQLSQFNEQSLLSLLESKSIEDRNFWQNQESLRHLYSKDFENKIQQLQNHQTLVIITNKKQQLKDVKNHLEQNYIIKQYEQKEYLFQDIQNTQSQTYVPLIIFNQLFSEQIINPILSLSRLNIQSNYLDISKTLEQVYGQKDDTFNIFIKLLQTFDNSKQIIRWIKLLEQYFENPNDGNLIKSQMIFNENQQIESIKNELLLNYNQLDKRFKDEFENIEKVEQVEQFFNQQQQNFKPSENNQQIVANFSVILYEIKNKYLTFLQLCKIGSEAFFAQANLDIDPSKNEKNNSEIGQYTLLLKEEGQKLYEYNFRLKEENEQLLRIQDKKLRELIISVLMRVLAIKLKKTVLNPNTRTNIGKNIQLI
ncbi:unnamed protein product [Paramecium sonneborni]|uniref:Uncharacterized protein n=1 Tax=Paramecium sonneborni TaxID=65129 RepID=A0A8S1RGD8_9CILI|nr:unnamed protein product [Paramecium sonneborni]